MFYKKIYMTLVPFFGINTEEKKIYKPEGITYWGYSDYADMVYEVYTSFVSKDHNGSFGYWVHDEEIDGAYKKALGKIFSHIKWSYKVRFEKWLK